MRWFLFYLGVVVLSPVPNTEAVFKPREQFNYRRRDLFCESASCARFDNLLVRSRLESIDPCDNFYDYVCSNFDQQRHLRYYESLNGPSQNAEIITNPIGPNDRPMEVVMKTFLMKCLNLTSDISSLRTIINDFGGWPFIGDPAPNITTAEILVRYFRTCVKYGYPADDLFSIAVGNDYRNTLNKTIYLWYPKYIEVKPNIFQDEHLSLYRYNGSSQDIINRILILLGNKLRGSESSSATQDLNQMRSFANFLRQNYPISTSTNYDQVVEMTLDDLQSQGIPFQESIRAYFGSITLPLSTRILVYCTQCLTMLNNYWNTVTPVQLQNYLMAGIALESAHYVDAEVNDYTQRLRRRPSNRRGKCIEVTDKQFRNVVDFLWVDRYFNRSKIPEIYRLFENYKVQLIAAINNTRILGPVSKERSIRKVQYMSAKFGYNPTILNETFLNRYYNGLRISGSTYFQSVLRLNNETQKSAIEELRRNNRLQLYYRPTSESTSYFHGENAILVPAVALTDLLYSSDRPQYINYALAGVAIGHEMGHALGPNALNYNEYGSLDNTSRLITETDRQAYQNVMYCLIDEYSSFQLPGSPNMLNGFATLIENVADNIGKILAYKTYASFAEVYRDLPLRSYQNFTALQMYWMSLGMGHCQRRSSSSDTKHAPYRFRLNGVVMNSVDFGRDFNCPRGSPMNPSEKCVLFNFM